VRQGAGRRAQNGRRAGARQHVLALRLMSNDCKALCPVY
jgi:hypothetical protein